MNGYYNGPDHEKKDPYVALRDFVLGVIALIATTGVLLFALIVMIWLIVQAWEVLF